jgi:hypothetical protein
MNIARAAARTDADNEAAADLLEVTRGFNGAQGLPDAEHAMKPCRWEKPRRRNLPERKRISRLSV